MFSSAECRLNQSGSSSGLFGSSSESIEYNLVMALSFAEISVARTAVTDLSSTAGVRETTDSSNAPFAFELEPAQSV